MDKFGEQETRTKAPPYANRSFWLAHAGDYEPSPPLQGQVDVDVAIIGGGFTGLSTAYHARKTDPSVSVAVLEAECVAFGASGRTSGWVVPTSILDPELAALLYSKEQIRELQDFGWEGFDYVRDLIAREKMASDFQIPGVTFTTMRGKQKKLEKFARQWTDHPRAKDSEWLDKSAVAKALNSDAFAAGFRLKHSGQINPVKHARELKRIAIEAGAFVYEQTPVMAVEEGTRFTIKTPEGVVRAKRLVLATNGYSHLLPPELGLYRAQLPMFIYQLITEPLTQDEWDALGWERRAQFYDKTTYFPPTCRTTVDGRLQFNLCDVYVGGSRSMEEAQRTEFYTAAERMFAKLFPVFSRLRMAQRWCGACSQPWDARPQVGSLKGGRISYAFGYSGAGVMMSQNLGRIVADLALERTTPLTEHWWVAVEGRRDRMQLRRFPRLPGIYPTFRWAVDYERRRGLAYRRRIGLA